MSWSAALPLLTISLLTSVTWGQLWTRLKTENPNDDLFQEHFHLKGRKKPSATADKNALPSKPDRVFGDYRGKRDSIVEPSSVPALGFSLSIFIFCWKPSDQGDAGGPPQGIFPDKDKREACPA